MTVIFLPIKYLGGKTKVYQCKHRLTGAERVVKNFKRTQMTEDHEKYFANEVSILKKLDHPNIIRLYEMYQDDSMYYLI